MAIDQETTPATTDLSTNRPVIENEIPTYRAVSTRAIVALICGFMAVFSFAHPAFYLFAVLAVILGVTADRAIQRRPEMLTGQTIARAGVLLGLVFGLSIATFTNIQSFLIGRSAGGFVARYAESLKSAPIEEIHWLALPPTTRAKTTAQENWSQTQTSSKQDQAMADMKNAPLKALTERLRSSAEQKIKFLRIENQTEDSDMLPVVLAVLEIEGPPSKGHSEHEFALAVLKGMIPEGSKSKSYEWWVQDLRYPYKPASYVVPDKPVDDGHGHAPGGGHEH